MVPGLLNHANALARGGHWVDAAKVYDHLVKLQPGFLGYEQGLERALAALRRQGGGRVPQVSMAPGAPIHALETRTLEVLLRHGLVGPGAVSEIRHPPAMEPDLGLLTLTAALRYGTAPAAAAGWARALDAWLARWAACRLQPLREAQFSAIRLRALGAGADGGPKVTVAMSCFNNAQTVEAAVVSVLGQTHRNLELVIVQSAATATAETSTPSLASPQSQRLRLPPVLPIVLYNGRPRWSAATDVADLIEPPPGRLARFTPRLSYLLLDEGAIDETAPLALKNLAAALFHLDKSRTPDTMQAVVGSLMQWLNQPEQDSLRRAFTVS